MLAGDVKRKKIGVTEVMPLVDKRGKPEVHFHCALTYVWGGDPMAIMAEDRDQMEIELGQFASRMKYGQIRKRDVDRAFEEFKAIFMQRLRDSGTLQQGE